jgi:hypothetical protein
MADEVEKGTPCEMCRYNSFHMVENEFQAMFPRSPFVQTAKPAPDSFFSISLFRPNTGQVGRLDGWCYAYLKGAIDF